jgi:hypothetical protein
LSDLREELSSGISIIALLSTLFRFSQDMLGRVKNAAIHRRGGGERREESREKRSEAMEAQTDVENVPGTASQPSVDDWLLPPR